jgi:chain length determinant protein (polysaccharide antigen chain regulator)
LDLWQVLVKRWRLIFSVSVVSVVIAVAYALSLPKTYQAEVHISPPLAKDLQGMQAEVVFSQFQGNLKSRASLFAFFEAEKLIEVLAPDRSAKMSEQSLFKVFQQYFSFNADKKDKSIFSVVLDWFDQEQVVDLLNRYIEMVALQTKMELVEEVKGDLLRKKRRTEQSIVSKRAMAVQRRSDEIARLAEAFLIADRLNIKTAESSSLLRNVDFGQSQGSNSIALFSQGSNTLKVQIAALKNRKSDDPYIVGVRGLQEQLVMINNQLLAVSDDFNVVLVDEKAYRPDFPIKD